VHADKDELIAAIRVLEERWKRSDFGKIPQFSRRKGADRIRTGVARLRVVRARSVRGAGGAA
jgi:hypothetical protein